MGRKGAALGSALFFLVAPGTVAGFIPWLITHWRIAPGTSPIATFAGAVLLLPFAAMLIECFARFVRHGGTPAPVMPTEHLVVTGLYRRVRNPMYVAVTGLILAQALLFGSAALLGYGLVIWLAFHLFVLGYEEPTLQRTYGGEYETYCKAVPRWLPRLRPWTPPASAHP
jgi:protein-S-isoprenylcysteine O-methyltransferase Ste14